MEFLNPGMLAALPAVSAPVLIHIINRSRFRVVEWAAMEYLLLAQKKVRRRVTMESWLLLLIRTLLVLLLILALAQPSFSSAIDIDTEMDWVVILDDSTSMQHAPEQQTAFQRARRTVIDKLEQLRTDRPQDRVTVVLSSDPGTVVTGAQRMAPEAAQIERLRERLDTLQPTDRPAEWTSVLQTVNDLVVPAIRNETRPVVAFVISDFRLPDWGDARRQALVAAAKGFDRVELANAGFEEYANLAVAGLECLDARPLKGVPAGFEVTLQRWGDAMSDVPLMLHLLEQIDDSSGDDEPAEGEETDEGEPADADATGRGTAHAVPGAVVGAPGWRLRSVPLGTIAIKANGETRHSFTATISSSNATAVAVSVPGDAYPADDLRWLSVGVAEELRVLVVDGSPGADDFEGASDYIRLALYSFPDGLAISSISYDQLPDTAFDNFDVVLTANIDRLDAETIDRLQAFVHNGGGIGWFLGDEADPDAYGNIRATTLRQQTTDERGDDAEDEGDGDGEGRSQPDLLRDRSLFPARLEELRNAEEEPFTLTVDRSTHPLMAMFEGAQGQELLRRTIRIDRAWKMIADDPQTVVCSLVAPTGSPTPVVVDAPYGEGRVIVTAIAPDTSWSNWPSTPSFPIYVHTLIGAVAPRDTVQRTLTPDGTWHREWAPDEFAASVTITGPDGAPIEQRATIAEGGTSMVLDYDAFRKAGLYIIEMTPVEVADPAFEAVVVNRALRESDLRPVKLEQLTAARENWELFETESADDVLILGGSSNSPIAWLLLALVGMLLVADVLIGAWAARRRLA